MSRIAPNRLLVSLFALALLSVGFTVSPFGHDDAACAHDFSGLCSAVPLGPGDVLDKGNYVHQGGQPGAPGAAPAGLAGATPATVVGHADPGGGFNADVVAHDGYAYLGSWGVPPSEELPDTCPSQGVRVFDLADPSAPALVSVFADAAGDPEVYGSWTEKVIVRSVDTPAFTGDLAAVSFQSCQGEAGFRGFGVYDVTDPAHPQRLGLVDTGPNSNGSHELWLQAYPGRAFVYTAQILDELSTSPDGTTPGQPDLQIFEVTDPAAPQRVAGWGAWAELGIEPITRRGLVTRVNFVHSVQQQGDVLYVSYWDLGTVQLDMSDPTQPRYLGRTDFRAREEGNAHSSWVTEDAGVLVQTDEDFSPDRRGRIEQSWGYTRLYDNSDPANPRRLSTFELPTTRQNPPPGPGFYTVHDPKIAGDDLYLSYYAEGVVQLDIANPSRPAVTGQFLPPPTADPRGFFAGGEPIVNVWGTFVTEDGYVLASDVSSGLWVTRFAG
jgi:hypothetical protein